MFATVPFPVGEWLQSKRDWINLKHHWLPHDWLTRIDIAAPRDIGEGAEVFTVVNLRDMRSSRDSEINRQDKSILPEFWKLLGVTPQSAVHWTSVYENFASPVIFMLKDKFNRARPYHYLPQQVAATFQPGWPAYPSGHSTQSFLLAHAFSPCFPDRELDLFALAERISINREIAGVHFGTDSLAGAELARQLYQEILLESPKYLESAAFACKGLRDLYFSKGIADQESIA